MKKYMYEINYRISTEAQNHSHEVYYGGDTKEEAIETAIKEAVKHHVANNKDVTEDMIIVKRVTSMGDYRSFLKELERG